MPSAGWLCRRVACGRRNPATTQKCECGARRPKKRVPAHKQALRDVTYEQYLQVNEDIHGVGEVCAVCGGERSQERRFDRDHDHTSGQSWSGKPRGLVCVACNILMPPKMTPGRAREIAAYLSRVETHYSGEPQYVRDERARLEASKRCPGNHGQSCCGFPEECARELRKQAAA